MPLLWVSLAFLAGILLAKNIALSTVAWLALAGASLLFGLLFWLIKRAKPGWFTWLSHWPATPLPLSLLFAVLFLGCARYQLAQPFVTPEQAAWYNDTGVNLLLEGVVAAPPEPNNDGVDLLFQVNRSKPVSALNYVAMRGLVQVKAPAGSTWRYGDELHIQGMLASPAEGGGTSYRAYLARQGVFSVMYRPSITLIRRDQGNAFLAAIYALKDRASQSIYRLYPDPEASLLNGILLGSDGGIPDSVQQAFKASGTAHIIAISGFNVSILAGLFTLVFGRLLGTRRRVQAALLSAVCIALYTVMVGAGASVVRAAIMGGLGLFARQLGRRQDGTNSLVATGAVMSLFNPLLLWDISFQLSFMATLGMILYAEPLSEWFHGLASRWLPTPLVERISGPIAEYFLFTLAAQFLTVPLMAYYFHRLSLVSLLANPVILPVQPALMVLGGMAVFTGIIFQAAGQALAYLSLPLLSFSIRGAEFFAGLPMASIVVGPVEIGWLLLFYGLLLTFTFGGERLRAVFNVLTFGAAQTVSLKPALLFCGLALLAALPWIAVSSAPDGRMHATLLDVGVGDAILIQTPGGNNILIDGGSSPTRLSDGLGRRLPFARTLDWLVIANPGQESISALPGVIDHFPPSRVLWAGPAADTRSARDLRAYLTSERIPITQAQAGYALNLGSGADLRVVNSGPGGGILLLEWGNFRMLLPVGEQPEDMQALRNGREIGRVSALVLAGSGSASLNPPEWIAALSPQVALLSVEAGDAKGRPPEVTLEALQGYTLLRTDLNGWIEITTDGQQMWVEVEKK